MKQSTTTPYLIFDEMVEVLLYSQSSSIRTDGRFRYMPRPGSQSAAATIVPQILPTPKLGYCLLETGTTILI